MRTPARNDPLCRVDPVDVQPPAAVGHAQSFFVATGQWVLRLFMSENARVVTPRNVNLFTPTVKQDFSWPRYCATGRRVARAKGAPDRQHGR